MNPLMMISLLLSLACLLPTTGLSINRRVALQSLAVGGASTSASPVVASPIPDFVAYQVKPDDSAALEPYLVPFTSSKFLQRVLQSKRGGAVWLGEHHNSVRDHNLQALILRVIHDNRQSGAPVAVGLEQVQRKFQPVLDNFVAGKIDLKTMRRETEWDVRWTWPFETYVPIFQLARERKIPLVALNVDSEDLTLVEKGGFPGIPRDRLGQYITDRPGFATFAEPRQFSTYVDYVIRPSYDMHIAMGLLKHTMAGEELDNQMSFRNFFSGRILWDEAMASAANEWTEKHPGGLIVSLVGADHVKFQNGIPGRYQRMATNKDCVSVLLNPTMVDSRSPGSSTSDRRTNSPDVPDVLTLQLRFLKDEVDPTSPEALLARSTGGVMPLADFLLIG